MWKHALLLQGVSNFGKQYWCSRDFQVVCLSQVWILALEFYDHYFKRRKESIAELSCSTSLSKEEEEGTKGEDSSKSYACSRFMSLLGFSSNRDSKSYEMSTTKGKKISSWLEENRNEVEAEIHEVKCKSL